MSSIYLQLIPIKEGVVASVPSIVVLISNLCQYDNSMETIFEKFCQKYNTPLLIIMGHQVQRDLAFYTSKGQENLEPLLNKIIQDLCKHPDLNIEESENFKLIPRFRYFKQGNISFTRKKLLPIMIESAKCFQ